MFTQRGPIVGWYESVSRNTFDIGGNSGQTEPSELYFSSQTAVDPSYGVRVAERKLRHQTLFGA